MKLKDPDKKLVVELLRKDPDKNKGDVLLKDPDKTLMAEPLLRKDNDKNKGDVLLKDHDKKGTRPLQKD